MVTVTKVNIKDGTFPITRNSYHNYHVFQNKAQVPLSNPNYLTAALNALFLIRQQ